MSLVINNNMMAANAARNLSHTYGKLSTSVQRLSSGLRINSAADDAAGLAIREMMRADIKTTQQGIRNAADAISMIQTADGSLGVIDEKLTRMKELAEQASSGTYTTVQRDIINSEYQAMAREIDRIANATNFNGIKLLDGSVSNQHGGQGIKIHFGVSNKAAEDYYFVNIGDIRATSSTGLRIGGDAKNDIWGQGAAASGPLAGPGCCTAGFSSLNGDANFISGQSFSFGYNWDWQENDDADLLSGKYLSGRYTVKEGESLQDLIDKVNAGTQSRVGIKIDGNDLASQIKNDGTMAICVGDEAYVYGDMEIATGYDAYQTTGTVKMSNWSKLDYTNNSSKGITLVADRSTTTMMGAAGIKGFERLEDLTVTEQHKIEASAESNSRDAISAKLSATVHGYADNWAGGSASNIRKVDFTVSSAGSAGTITSASLKTAMAGSSGLVISGGGTIGFNSASTGSFKIGTGVWVDDNGNYTRDAKLAKKLGFKEAMASVTVNNGQFSVVVNGHSSATVTAANVTALATAINNLTKASIGILQAGKNMAGKAGLVNASTTTVDPTDDLFPKNMTSAATFATKDIYVDGVVDKSKQFTQVATSRSSAIMFTAENLAKTINENANSSFWAMVDQNDASMIYVFNKEGGNHNDIRACEVAATDKVSRDSLTAVSFQNVESGQMHEEGTSMTLGGQFWGTMKPVQTKSNQGNEVWNVTLNGRDVGAERDLWITNFGELNMPGIDENIITGMDRNAFVEIQNAANSNWAGAEVRTQSAAQEALDAITEAIVRKDKVRADLGAMQNRLENTMTNLEIQAENLQASESRISDVDVAKEMTEFTKNNVLTQAGVSMLAQANSMSQLALSLLG